MAEKVPDDIRIRLSPGLIDLRAAPGDDRIECAYITLRGCTERFLMLLQYRSEHNYETGMKALEQSIADYRVLTKK